MAIPRVSIGIPVFNGATYIKEALDSLVNQTFQDFEIIISDNASQDDTPSICKAYSRADERVRYVRHDHNHGAALNYNFVFNQARSPYFKWASHDDVCAPLFLERCVEVLDRSPETVLCFPQTIIIDKDSHPVKDYPNQLHLQHRMPAFRFRSCLFRRAKESNAIFGLARTSALAKTQLIGGFVGSDNILLAQLALLGLFHEIDDALFLRREHGATSLNANITQRSLHRWFDPLERRCVMPTTLRWGIEYAKSVYQVPLTFATRLLCLYYVLVWFYRRKRKLLNEIKDFHKIDRECFCENKSSIIK